MPFIFAGCTRPQAEQREIVRPVKAMTITAGDEIHRRVFPGKVEATKTAELAFQVSGLVVEFPVKEGQKLAKGDVIGRIRPDEFQARLTALQGQLDQARAALRALQSGERPEQVLRLEAQVRGAEAKLTNARAELDRATRLLERRAMSRTDFDLAETNHRVAKENHEAARQLLEKSTIGRAEDIEANEATVRGLEGRVVEASLQLKDTTLIAPYDGVIAARFIEPNQNVQAKAPVVRLQDTQEIAVAVDVPEAVMASLRRSDIVEILAEFSGAPGVRFPVEIREVAQVADPATQTFRVTAAMKSPQEVNLL
ncbi:HlyD family efflux transporter periplasmic adaptor subunit, partial [bacterium]|nr:HlyD family efflux transporter periplasmic adaptor subunit [bacterium]